MTSTEQLIAVRAVMGVAAAMTTPGSMALAFRLFGTEDLRVRAITLISTAGLVGLAIGPTLGGLVLAVAPWQVLLIANAPIAGLALLGIRLGIAADDASTLHREPVDFVGALLGTASIVLALMIPTLFVNAGAGSVWPWLAVLAAVGALTGFVLRERSARFPLLPLPLLAVPLVSSGLAFKAAAGLAVSGLSFLVTLQLQFAWGWPPALAAAGMLPQVAVLLASGRFVAPLVRRVGLGRAAWMSAAAVVLGLAVFALFGRFGYGAVVVALVLVAAGMRVVGVVAGTNVLNGLPPARTSIGAALVDTSSELATAIGIAAAGTILAALFAGNLGAAPWDPTQTGQFDTAVTVAGLALTALSAALVAFGIIRSR
ncbi:MFS transporter [Herbiconiux sp.]|uniref:MFS transporter n=1 Tax=Herbiconiux sp. TaxID=1871186 RepID=UPI0025C5FD1E|nr:MFS transporter [Herbiconiux sp.]